MTTIGDMNERVTLQSENRTPDDSGGYASVWVTIATLWGAVAPVSSREDVEAAQLTGRASYRFRLRARGDVTAAQRLLWREGVYNIRAVTQLPGHIFTELLAEEGSAV